jgi:phosphate-selective porin O/P
MKKLVYSALALSVTTAGAFASDSDWSNLDQEIEALTASNVLDTTGPKFSGRVRTYYESSGDVSVGDGPNDLGNFNLRETRLKMTGSRGDYGYTMQVEFAGGISLLDAFLDFPLGGQVNGRFGQFKAGFSRSGLLSGGNIFFVDRNIIGNLWSGRRQGFMLSGEFDQLGWWLTIQDGGNVGSASAGDPGDEYLITAKIAFDLMGEGANAKNEGAYGGTEEPSATAAIGFYDDSNVDSGDGTLLEFHGGTNVYAFGLDILDVGDGLVASNGNAVASPFNTTIAGNTTPISLFGTYMLQPDTWEIGVRFQDYDNTANEDKLDIGVINHIDGHKLKWTIQYSTTTSDVAANEVDWIAIQLQLAF